MVDDKRRGCALKLAVCGRMLAAGLLFASVSACSGAARSSVPLGGALHAAQQGRHNAALASQPSDSSPCGTCSCTNTDDGSGGSGGMSTVPDDGAACQGGPMAGSSGGGGTIGDGSNLGVPGDRMSSCADPSKCVLEIATQGPATQGKSCNEPGGSSASIGSVISGPDIHSSEINNVFYVAIGNSNTKGSLGAYGGFFLTTFGGTTWYQTPGTLPGTNTVVYVSMGNNFAISPSSPLSTAGFVNAVANALGSQNNSGIAKDVKDAVIKLLNGLTGSSPSAFVDPCFDGPWTGTPSLG
jgi:hypothetical protein